MMLTRRLRPALILPLLLAALLARAATDPADLLAKARQAIGTAPATAAAGIHLRLDVREVFHPSVTAVFEGHTYRYGQCQRDLYLQNGVLVSSSNWDGKTLLFGESTRLRYPLAIDVITFRRNARLERLLDLGQDALRSAMVTLGPARQLNGRSYPHLVFTWPDDPIPYHLYLDPVTFLPHGCQVDLPSLYGGVLTQDTTRILVQEWSTAAPRYPTRFTVVYPEGPIDCRVLAREPWTPPKDDDFSPAAMRRVVDAFKPIPPDLDQANAQRRQAIADLLAAKLKPRLDGPAAKIVSLGNPELYRRAILDGTVTILVAPGRLGDHVGGTYMPVDLDLKGQPRLDVITIRRQVDDPDIDTTTLLHETTHLILRRHQTVEPLLAPDDEDLTAYQEEMAHTLAAIKVFDDVLARQPHNDAWRANAKRRWTHVVFRIKYARVNHQFTDAQLAQFEKLTGCRFHLDEIRQAYLKAGVDTDILDAPLNARYQGFLTGEATKQRTLRAQYGLPTPE